MKKLLASVIVLVLMGSFASGITINQKKSVQQPSRGTLYVGGTGGGNYTSIQEAIDDANSGDTVFVYNGTYYEIVEINKNGLILQSENKYLTIIDGMGADNTLLINTCQNVVVEGFTIINSSGSWLEGAGIKLHSSGSCNYNTIRNCIIRDNDKDGILIWPLKHQNANYNTIIDCEIYNNGKWGIQLNRQDGPSWTNFNNILNCTVYNNTNSGGICIGTHIYGTNNLISDCEVYGNLNGIHFDGDYSQILNTYCYDNIENGIWLSSEREGTIANCTLSNNGKAGVNSSYQNWDNHFYHNNFFNNNPNTWDDELTNTWYNDIIHEGNYYDDYTGIDSDGDGIGDTPYDIPGGSNQDNYPLMYPWYPTHPDTVYIDDDYDASTPGWGYDKFNRIQYGINEVPEGGTVYVNSGTYNEWVNVTKTIELHGENRETTIIDGTGLTYCLIVHTPAINTFITNITTMNAQSLGVWISGSNSIIDNVTSCWNAEYGFYPREPNSNIVIRNCHGHNNTKGFYERGTDNLEVYGCTFNDNTDLGMYTCFITTNAYIHHNNFFSNAVNVEDDSDGSNLWEYNYYDDYTGIDADGDGIGDTPYNITGTAGEQDLYPYMNPNGWLNEPPEKPTIDGPITGEPGVSYEYTFTTTDPDDDQLYYYVDWGDTSVQDWFGPFDSGENATASHSWSQGNYEIKVKAKDTSGFESVWSDPFPITMPRDKAINNPFLSMLLERFPLLQKLLQQLGL